MFDHLTCVLKNTNIFTIEATYMKFIRTYTHHIQGFSEIQTFKLVNVCICISFFLFFHFSAMLQSKACCSARSASKAGPKAQRGGGRPVTHCKQKQAWGALETATRAQYHVHPQLAWGGHQNGGRKAQNLSDVRTVTEVLRCSSSSSACPPVHP